MSVNEIRLLVSIWNERCFQFCVSITFYACKLSEVGTFSPLSHSSWHETLLKVWNLYFWWFKCIKSKKWRNERNASAKCSHSLYPFRSQMKKSNRLLYVQYIKRELWPYLLWTDHIVFAKDDLCPQLSLTVQWVKFFKMKYFVNFTDLSICIFYRQQYFEPYSLSATYLLIKNFVHNYTYTP